MEEFKWLAGELRKALEAGGLEADEKKRKKALAALDRIDFDRVADAVRELGVLEEKKAAAAKIVEKETAAERERSQKLRQVDEMMKKRVELERKINALEKKLFESLEEIEKTASRAAGVEIKILEK